MIDFPMPRYAALCCYFGQWPSHFQFWLESCRHNVAIDFLLVTDIPTEGFAVPANVRVVPMSFAEVQAIIGHKFPEIVAAVDRPYKLCDFKTAYGYIFDDLFDGYDYWGYYDIDTIWGDIVRFIPPNDDCHLVKIFPCGHLSFIRNAAPWNRVFELVNRVAGTPCRNNMTGKSVVTWQECFASAESHFYDEEGGLEPLFSHLVASGELSADDLYHAVDFDNILPPWRFDHFYSINFPAKSNFLLYQYDGGTLSRVYLKGLKPRSEAISYVHLSRRSFTVSADGIVGQRYVIFPDRFVNNLTLNFWKVLWLGRQRYVANVFRRIIRKFQ